MNKRRSRLASGALVSLMILVAHAAAQTASNAAPAASTNAPAAIAVATNPAAPAATNAPPPSAPTNGPLLSCDEPRYDFGELKNDQSVRHTFVLKNVGTAPLEIANVRASCGCTATALDAKTVAPGQSTALNVTLNLTGRKGRQVKSIYVESNDAQKPHFRLEVVGTATVDIEVQPVGIHFGTMSKNGAVERELTLTAKSNVVFHIIKVDTGSPLFTASVMTNADGRSYTVKVISAGPRANGTCRATVQVFTDLAFQNPIAIPVAGFVAGDIIASPDTLLVVGAATNHPHYVTLYSPAGTAFNVGRIDVPQPTMEINAAPISQGRYRLEIRNVIPTPDLDGKTIRVTTDLGTAREITIPIRVLNLSGTANPDNPSKVDTP
jgi:hypothetical protein